MSAIPRESSQGLEGRSVYGNRPSHSETPAPGAAQNGSLPKLTLKLRFNNSEAKKDPHPGGQNEQSAESSHHTPLCTTLPPPVTTRTGRKVHKPQHADVIQGSEYDHMMGRSYQGFGDDDKKLQPPVLDDHRTYNTLAVSEHGGCLTNGSAHKLGRAQGYSPYPFPDARQQGISVGHPHRSDEDEQQPSSVTLQIPSPTFEHGSFKPSQDVYTILDNLQNTNKIQVDLPSLSNGTDPDLIQPYSAQLLTHLYITCYQRKLWNLCDLLADTWIRAFHARRKKSQVAPEHQLWRPNKALEQRKRKAYEAWRDGHYVPSEFDPEPRYYGLEASDPDLAPDVTDMHISVLNALYEQTQPDCGVRMLWADALALAGDDTEKSICVAQKRGVQLHLDLLFNIMQTSLRMVRRNLTLKIEESTEGAWCKRYHEHAKHGLPCYREVAAKSKEGGGDGQVEVGEEEYHAFMQEAGEGTENQVHWLRRDKKQVSFGDDTDPDGDSVVE